MLITIVDEETSPVPLAQMKEHLRVDHDDDDVTIGIYRDAAVAHVEQESGRTLARKTIEYRPEYGDLPLPLGTPNGGWWWLYQGVYASVVWPLCIEVPVFPVRDVREIRYLDESGVEQSVDDADFIWDLTATGAVIKFITGWTPPRLAPGRPGVVRIVVDAGYDAPEGGTGTGEDPALALPRLAKPAIMLLAAHWYENRTPVAGPEKATDLPLSVQACIDKLRIRW